MVLLQTRISCILRKRGEEEQTANTDEYSLDDKMRICRLGRNPIFEMNNCYISLTCCSAIIWGATKQATENIR